MLLVSRVAAFLFWSVVFGVSYTQAALFYSNQNQYFLHGEALAGRGDLDQDWLAKTNDPTPVFSAAVAGTAKVLPDWTFHVYYLLILGLYFHCSVGLFTWLADGTPNKIVRLCFITLFVVLHAGVLRLVSARLLGVDYPWYFQAGVAGQYLLGFGLQPSVFGVFLLASILAFLRGRPWLTVAWTCLAAVLHGTYLPTAAFLTLAYMVSLYRERGLRDAILLGGLALILVMPVVIYNLVTFAPSSAENFAEAQRILAQIRIPHHAVIARWFDGIALAQVAWVVAAMCLVRRTKLLPILLIPFLCSLALTLVQLATGSDTVALLFPWRTSAVLVPIATTVILAKIVTRAGPRLQGLAPAPVIGACALVLGTCVVGGAVVPLLDLGYRTNREEVPLLEFVKKTHRRGDVYLIPVEIPKTGAGARGAYSTNFLQAPRTGRSDGLIAVDLQGFRLCTGAPIFVDFKSIPYEDKEVLDWYRRLLWCRDFYLGPPASAEALRDELIAKGITHVVATTRRHRFASLGSPVYEDDAYAVFAVKK